MDGMEHPCWLFIYCKNNLASSMHSRIYWRIVDLWAERLIVLIYLFQNLTGGYATLESRLDEAHHLIKIRLTEIIQARIWDFWSSSRTLLTVTGPGLICILLWSAHSLTHIRVAVRFTVQEPFKEFLWLIRVRISMQMND
jgi:hypothetical protein